MSKFKASIDVSQNISTGQCGGQIILVDYIICFISNVYSIAFRGHIFYILVLSKKG